LISNFHLDQLAKACHSSGMSKDHFLSSVKNILDSVDSGGICCKDYWQEFNTIAVVKKDKYFGLSFEFVTLK
jgi:hypothetical protein